VSITERVKHIAGRWLDAHYLPPAELPDPLPQPRPRIVEVLGDEDGTGMWLPAGLVAIGEQVQVADRWHTVSHVEAYPGDGLTPGTTILYFDDLLFGAWLESLGYASPVYVRDAAAIISAEIEAVCDGHG
jgi:hypothetical protein